MDDSDLMNGSATGWWLEADPEHAHRKYMRMHSSDTNRSKLWITERMMSRCEWAGKSVLEYGCGGGYLTIWMAKRGATVQAVEMNSNAIGAVEFYAAQEGVAERVRITEGNAERETIDGRYDFILAKDLIEHLEDDQPFFQRLGEQLRPGGRVYLATQNDHSLNYLLEGWYERVYHGNKRWYGWDKTHHRFYNAPMLAQRLRAVGIVPECWGSSYLVPWRFVTKRITGKPRPWGGWATIDQSLGMRTPFAKWGWSIMVLGRKD